jgi:effector-binding domain-containing protein
LLKKQWAGFVFAFLLPILVVYWWWGGFNTVKLSEGRGGPYHYAYLEHIGDLAKVADAQQAVYRDLKAQGVEAGRAITILYDDPRTVKKSELRAQTGFMIPENTKVSPPLKIGDIPERAVITATVNAGLLLAPSKAYAALDDYLKAHNQTIKMPTVEIYQAGNQVYSMGTLTLEMNAD